MELAAPKDCATPEPGVCSGSAETGRAPPSAAAMLSESKLVIASDCCSIFFFCQQERTVRKILSKR